MTRKVCVAVLFMAALVDIGIGIHSVAEHNAHAVTYWDRETLYDGPWLPIEFILLGAAVIVHKGLSGGLK